LQNLESGELKSYQGQIEQMLAEKMDAADLISELQDTLADLQTTQEELTAEISQKKASIDSLQRNLADSLTKSENSEARLSLATTALEQETLRNTDAISSLTTTLDSKNSEIESLNSTNYDLKSSIEKSKAQIKTLNAEIKTLNAKITTAEENSDAAHENLEAAQDRAESLAAHLDEAENKAKTLANANKTLLEQLEDWKLKYEALEANYADEIAENQRLNDSYEKKIGQIEILGQNLTTEASDLKILQEKNSLLEKNFNDQIQESKLINSELKAKASEVQSMKGLVDQMAISLQDVNAAKLHQEEAQDQLALYKSELNSGNIQILDLTQNLAQTTLLKKELEGLLSTQSESQISLQTKIKDLTKDLNSQSETVEALHKKLLSKNENLSKIDAEHRQSQKEAETKHKAYEKDLTKKTQQNGELIGQNKDFAYEIENLKNDREI
jgi:chromosome segregation ATPase